MKHGGQRKGAGRKPAPNPKKLKAFRPPSPEAWEAFLSMLTGDAVEDFEIVYRAVKASRHPTPTKTRRNKMIIKDKDTNEVIGKVTTNQSLTFDEAMRLAGFEWKTLEADGVECDGWYDGDVLYDESNVEIEAE